MNINHPFNFVKEHMRGKGLEIGPLDRPQEKDESTLISYADRRSTEELKSLFKHDPNVDVNKIVNIEHVCDAQDLSSINDETYDFVVASHLLEHVANPIQAIKEWLRVVKPGGYVYMIVPDKRFTFDKTRELTPLIHFMRDYENKVTVIDREHYQDFWYNVDRKSNVEEAFKTQHPTHAHTFIESSLHEMLTYMQMFMNFSVVDFKRDGMHIAALLQKGI